MIYYIASFLSLVSGLILFGLGTYGLMGMPRTEVHLLTVLLEPSGLSEKADNAYLALLAFLGFWLTLRIHVRIPAALALGMVLGKILIVGSTEHIGVSLTVALALIIYAVILRLITVKPDEYESVGRTGTDEW